jgi:predicted ATP-grasp superfamily ATP-dependent carboligase
MPVEPQILAAISGAISAYLAEEEACQAAALSAAGAQIPGPPPNLWGLAGRSEAMQLRMLMQRRSLR